MTHTPMSPSEVKAELDAVRARRGELARTETTSAATHIELLRERAQLCRREVDAWDALDTSAIADPAVSALLLRGGAAAALHASVQGREHAEDAAQRERLAAYAR